MAVFKIRRGYPYEKVFKASSNLVKLQEDIHYAAFLLEPTQCPRNSGDYIENFNRYALMYYQSSNNNSDKDQRELRFHDLRYHFSSCVRKWRGWSKEVRNLMFKKYKGRSTSSLERICEAHALLHSIRNGY